MKWDQMSSTASTVLGAGRSFGSWVVRHPLLAALIALALALALFGKETALSRARAAAGYLREVATAVEDNRALKKEIAARDAAWQLQWDEASHAVVQARAARKAPRKPAGDAAEIKARLEMAGFPGRIVR